MVKKVLLLGVAVFFIISLSGCATTARKNNDLEVQGLRNKVLALETQLREKDDEINSLRESPAKGNEEVTVGTGKVADVKQADPKQIQTALKNAGYFEGTVDGKMGRMTRKAVRAFQKANNLPVDGKVGKKTWAALKEYLDKKVK
jgi:outer membrane murein-binding lipoprotein Lpp